MLWLLQAWVEDEFQFIAKGDHGVADLQLESSSWGLSCMSVQDFRVFELVI